MAKIEISYANLGVQKDINALIEMSSSYVLKGHFTEYMAPILHFAMMKGHLHGEKVIMRLVRHVEMNKIIGFSLLAPARSANFNWRQFFSEKDWEIYGFAISDEWRGYGVGKLLLEDAIRILEKESEGGGCVFARTNPVSSKMKRMLKVRLSGSG